MKKNKGFTLIELLAVIVVLAVITLITTPLILNVIEKSKKGALQDSAYGLIESANLYYAQGILDESNPKTEFTFENGEQTSENKLSFKGKIENGSLRLYSDGNTALCITEGNYAAVKNVNEKTVTVVKGRCSYNSETEEYETVGVCQDLQDEIDQIKEEQNKGTIVDGKYQEKLLNGAVPQIKNNLIPVTIEDDGTVKKADISQKWYSYEEKKWANAVILVDESKTYKNGDTIPESNIESYFVWIPRYKYRLWNTGTASKTAHSIEIVFENKTTAASTGSSNGEWLTHPAFTAFDTNGIWVGKFETGYSGATSTESAQVNSSDVSKVIIKPNVYSWRSITVGNIFTTSYNYQRELDSHMMKNTEWGSVAYLSHSIYGIDREVNINNNSSYKTGYSALPSTSQQTYPGESGDGSSYNQPYNTAIGYLASTTGNITGVYDMSGGTHEIVAGYISGNVGSSGLTVSNYDSKYFDVYNSSSTTTSYQYRILGDATGEMGPFKNYLDGDNTSRYHDSWYADYSNFVDSYNPWFARGGYYDSGLLAGQFLIDRDTGLGYTYFGFRLVLIG